MAFSTTQFGVTFTADGAIHTVGNGAVLHYQRRDGIYYRVETPEAVITALEQARSSQQRVRIFYGDTVSGRDWLEEWDVEGRVANSIGPLKVPLLIPNPRCRGGPAVLDHCIVKIKTTGRRGTILYQHPLYHTGTFVIRSIAPGETNLLEEGYTHAVDVDGVNHANFRSLPKAERFVSKMLG